MRAHNTPKKTGFLLVDAKIPRAKIRAALRADRDAQKPPQAKLVRRGGRTYVKSSQPIT